MSSLVVFPFKEEARDVVSRNLEIAAGHQRVAEVLAIAATPEEVAETLPDDVLTTIKAKTHTEVSIAPQERIGTRRRGKGDAMNTGLRLFLESDHDRLHFYDADITNFDSGWIDSAEHAADRGFGVVRHYFPRASTDAMITWMVTRPGFALTHPKTNLWRVGQPLGGELLLTRDVAGHLVTDPRVTDRSDWGIDTMITFSTIAGGYDLAEVFIAQGKQHSLYDSLADLRTMVVECFDAIGGLRDEPVAPPGRYEVEPSRPAGSGVGTRVAYSVERTLPLLTEGWSEAEIDLARSVPHGESLLGNRETPSFEFADADAWRETLVALLDLADPSDDTWQSLIFRFWVARVLAYTTSTALGGHTHAMARLERSVVSYSRAQH